MPCDHRGMLPACHGATAEHNELQWDGLLQLLARGPDSPTDMKQHFAGSFFPPSVDTGSNALIKSDSETFYDHKKKR